MDITPLSPNTAVKLLKGVPLDSSYKDTLDFSSVSSQISYFTSKAKFAFNNLSPIRLQNAIRVPVVADKLYDCNYIMFQNANFGSKWFYAFVNRIEFINVNMSYVYFDIDVIQTWWFDITIKPSFVEREHIQHDTVGSNLVPENLELGEYVSADFDGTNLLGEKVIVIAATFDSTMTNVTGGTYSGIYSGLYYTVYDNYAAVNDFIEKATTANKSDGIVSIFMMPRNFVGDIGSSAKTYDITKPMKLDNINGYVPRNKKLFTHPFNFLYVTNLQGNSVEFKYEYFDAISCTFGLAGDMSCNPQIFLYPQNYKGVPANYNEKMVLDGYPQCSYSTDSFKAWLAQNGSTTAVSTLGTALAMSASATPMGAFMAASSIATTLGQTVIRASQPRQSHGASGGSALFAAGLKDFAFMHMSIRKEFAEIIDGYFDMYGYATHKVKVPNITGRPSWNYVKTQESKIVGSVPFEDIEKIRSIFNSGVTFWHGDWVGDYGRGNQ